MQYEKDNSNVPVQRAAVEEHERPFQRWIRAKFATRCNAYKEHSPKGTRLRDHRHTIDTVPQQRLRTRELAVLCAFFQEITPKS